MKRVAGVTEMPLSKEAFACVTQLTYAVQFESDIGAGIDRVLRRVVNVPTSTVKPEAYVRYIDEVLASKTDLKAIDPGRHENQAIRNFLSSIKSRLEAQLKTEREAQLAARS